MFSSVKRIAIFVSLKEKIEKLGAPNKILEVIEINQFHD